MQLNFWEICPLNGVKHNFLLYYIFAIVFFLVYCTLISIKNNNLSLTSSKKFKTIKNGNVVHALTRKNFQMIKIIVMEEKEWPQKGSNSGPVSLKTNALPSLMVNPLAGASRRVAYTHALSNFIFTKNDN